MWLICFLQMWAQSKVFGVNKVTRSIFQLPFAIQNFLSVYSTLVVSMTHMMYGYGWHSFLFSLRIELIAKIFSNDSPSSICRDNSGLTPYSSTALEYELQRGYLRARCLHVLLSISIYPCFPQHRYIEVESSIRTRAITYIVNGFFSGIALARLDSDMGSAALLWPTNRACSAADGNIAPCGSAAGLTNCTDFSMSMLLFPRTEFDSY